jgi:tetratricopeptide (TPR) repeat protein
LAAAFDQLSAAGRRHFEALALFLDLGVICAERADHEQAATYFGWVFECNPQETRAIIGLLAALSESPRGHDLAALIAEIQAHHPTNSDILTWCGLAADAAALPDLAIDCYEKVLRFDAQNKAARHNLATKFRAHGQEAKALRVIEAFDARKRPPESWMLQAHLHADQGNYQAALNAYIEALDRDPGLIAAHESLARLLPQLGRAPDALNSYWAALERRPENRRLWASAIAAAKDLRMGAELESLAASACDRFGASSDLLVALALGFAYQGNTSVAIAQLRRVLAVEPQNIGGHLHLVPLLIADGSLAEAEVSALAATQLDPLDQSGWSWLTLIWRLRNDPREAWLADYDRFVISIDLSGVMNSADIGGLSALSEHLSRLHKTSHHPLEQSPRGGTQTRGDIFQRNDRVLQAVKAHIRDAVETAVRALPEDPAHPFLSRKAHSVDFAGAWSVRLHTGGHHAPHIHHKGWMSSAFYVALPSSVVRDDTQDGSLTFGVPAIDLAVPLAPRRIVKPKLGQLVIFPSYFWHGTLPFEDEEPRLTMACDMLPAS